MKLYKVYYLMMISFCISRCDDSNQRSLTGAKSLSDQHASDVLVTMFGDDDLQIDAHLMNFDKPPQPSRLQILLRQVGIPIFLKYVAFYTYIRNWIRWLKSKASGKQYIPVGDQHYAQ